MSRRILIFAALSLSLVRPSAYPVAAEKRPITEQDLFRFNWIADPQISPDGSRVAFVRVQVDEKKTGYTSEIWIVSTRGEVPRRLSSGPHDGGPRWSADGGRLIFTRSVEKNGEPQPPQIYLLPMGGGEATAVTSLPKGAAAPPRSPDGLSVAFLRSTSDDGPAKADK